MFQLVEQTILISAHLDEKSLGTILKLVYEYE